LNNYLQLATSFVIDLNVTDYVSFLKKYRSNLKLVNVKLKNCLEGKIVIENKNKNIVKDWIDALNKNRLSVLEEIIHPGFVDHDPVTGQTPDKVGYIKLITNAHHGSETPYQIQIMEILSEDDKVVIRVTAHNSDGTMIWKGIGIFRLQDEMIIERWACRQKV